VAKSRFWRFPGEIMGAGSIEHSTVITVDVSKIALIKRGHGTIVGNYEDARKCAIVTHIGVVIAIDRKSSQIEVQWKRKEIILRPHANGAVHWKTNDVFNFEPNVAKRYLFDSMFAEEYSSVDWSAGSVKQNIVKSEETHQVIDVFDWVEVKRKKFPKSGFVYLVKKANFYKFQGSKELPHRSPFFLAASSEHLEIINVAWFTDFRYAESDLQSKFHEHRFDGEYLHLSENDIQSIKDAGVLVNKLTLTIDGTTVTK
jgi:hypothetical protein